MTPEERTDDLLGRVETAHAAWVAAPWWGKAKPRRVWLGLIAELQDSEQRRLLGF